MVKKIKQCPWQSLLLRWSYLFFEYGNGAFNILLCSSR